jgi:hypothetical protein
MAALNINEITAVARGESETGCRIREAEAQH